MKNIRLGMIGYGFRGSGLLGMCKSVEQLEATAICDANVEIEKKIKSEFPNVAYFQDYDEMLESDTIDAVLIETPPMTHASCAMSALKKNIHVLSDVPALHSLDEAEPLWDAAQDSDAVYMFGSTANYFGFVETCDDLRKKGLLGTPFYLEAEYIHDLTEFAKMTPWRQSYEPIRYCSHSLGPLLQWLEQDIISVSCMDTGSHVHHENKEGHDAMVAIFKTTSGAVIKLLVSFTNSNTHGQHRYLYHGTQGCFECTWPLTGEKPQVTFSTKQVYGLDKTMSLPVSSERPELATIDNVSGHGPLDYAMLCDFVKAINGEPCKLDLKAGLKMSLPGLYALKSAELDGQLTEIKYPWP